MNKKWLTPTFSFDDIGVSKPDKSLNESRKLKRNLSNNSLELCQTLKKLKVQVKDEKPCNELSITTSKVKVELNYAHWLEKITPKSVEDLCIHPKKIEEIEAWLNNSMVNHSSPSLLHITGPSGSAKTIAMKILCKEMNYDIAEWITPLDVDIIRSISTKNDDENDITYRVSQSDKFEQYLLQSSRYASLFNIDAKRILLVKDFPNGFLKKPQIFHDLLLKYSIYGKSPLVFITTDTKSKHLNAAFNLFPDSICSQFQIHQISLNAISSTLLKKALKSVCTMMSDMKYSNLFRIPDQDVIDSIILASHGDIRSAVLNLYVASLKNPTSLAKELLVTQSSNTATSKKSKKNKNYKLTSIGTDENLNLMHALGRVLYPKFVGEDVTTTDQQKYLLHSPDDITEAFLTQPRNFQSFIHTNYIHRFSSIEDISSAADILSVSDLLMCEYREDQLTDYALNIAVRGVMLYNNKPASGWKSIRGPRKIERIQNFNDNSKYHKDFESDLFISNNVYVSDYKTFINMIKKKEK